MCRTYTNKRGRPYVRYCKPWRRRGYPDRRDLTDAEIEAGNIAFDTCVSGRGKGRAASKRYTITFTVDAYATEESFIYIASRADARWTFNPESRRLSLFAERGITARTIQIAESFGWSVVDRAAAD